MKRFLRYEALRNAAVPSRPAALLGPIDDTNRHTMPTLTFSALRLIITSHRIICHGRTVVHASLKTRPRDRSALAGLVPPAQEYCAGAEV